MFKMAGRFKVAEWEKIISELNRDPEFYGLPEGGREASLVLASFNIRKLGRSKNREREIDFLATFCAKCDLVAIQEVQDNLEGLRSLKDRMEFKIAGDNEFVSLFRISPVQCRGKVAWPSDSPSSTVNAVSCVWTLPLI